MIDKVQQPSIDQLIDSSESVDLKMMLDDPEGFNRVIQIVKDEELFDSE